MTSRPHRHARIVDAPWTSKSRVGMGLIVLSCVITWVVAFLGPSSVTLNPGPASSALPPWFIPVEVGKSIGLPLNEWIVVPALWIGIAIGAVGLWVCYRAIGVGWRPPIHKLFGLGVGLNLFTACVPPLTSADILMYAAYGRLTKQGFDPYAISPAEIFRQSYDPVLVYTEKPWQDTPSVYGPIASGSQWLANVLGGDSMHDVVFWLQMMCVIPFIIVCAVMIKLAHGNAARQTRAVLFTIMNPLLIWAVVAGGHNEALTLMFAICALLFVRRSSFATGLFIGLAGSVKVSLVFYGMALAWGYRRDWHKLVGLVLGALIPLAIGYGILAPQAMLAASRNTGYVSQGSWGPPMLSFLELFLKEETARTIVSKGGWVLMLILGWMLSCVLPWKPVPGAKLPARNDPLTIATRTAVVLCAAWVMTSPYSLPWYDLIAWAPLALLGHNKLDKVLMVRGAALSIAYVSARPMTWGPAMVSASWFVREALCSGIQVALFIYIVVWWWQEGHRLPTPSYLQRGWYRLRAQVRY